MNKKSKTILLKIKLCKLFFLDLAPLSGDVATYHA